jgi:uncharacterized repeat protein (TIGR01451 family)
MMGQTRWLCLPFLTVLTLGFGLTLVALMFLSGVSAYAASSIRYVAPSGVNSGNTCLNSATPCATVQYAVDVAAPGDEIRIAAGTYTGLTFRDGYTSVVYITKSVTLRGGFTLANWGVPDPKNKLTTLNAQGQGLGVGISGTITVTVEGLHITGGQAATPNCGLCAAEATVALRDNTIFNNAGSGVVLIVNREATISGNSIYSNTSEGVGLYQVSGPVNLSHNSIYSNANGGIVSFFTPANLVGNIISGNTGGGVVLQYSQRVTLSDNLIDRNQMRGENCSFSTPSCQGGGVFLYESQATLSGNTISRNEAKEYGGGVAIVALNNPSSVRLSRNTIISNTADRYGGGMFDEGKIYLTLEGNLIADNVAEEIGGGAALGSLGYPITLNGDIIRDNTSDTGGGLALAGEAVLTNTVIADNQASLVGSGLSIVGTSARLLHTTIARNSGGDGSGIYLYPGSSSTVALTNTLLVSQTVGISVGVGSTATLNGVLWFGNGTNTGGAGTITVTNEITGDPAFFSDGYHLMPTSAALDQGVDAGVNVDVDGQPRPFGLAPDLGADEGQPALLVSKQAEPELALPGRPLTYTLRVTNTGFVDLHATITDTLPGAVIPTGVPTWTATIPANGGVWTGQVMVTVAPEAAGPLINGVQVSSVEGASGAYTQTAAVGRVVYLPVIWRN